MMSLWLWWQIHSQPNSSKVECKCWKQNLILGFVHVKKRHGNLTRSYCWWLKSGDHQLRLIVYPFIYKVFLHPRRLFGISSINNISLIFSHEVIHCFHKFWAIPIRDSVGLALTMSTMPTDGSHISFQTRKRNHSARARKINTPET